MIGLLAFRNLLDRPWRSLFLLLGYSLGVSVMIVLLSIGEALLTQARDEKLIGGGEITVLPQGIDLELLKTGGLGGMFFSIDHARFIYRQLLGAPRLATSVEAVAPQIEGKLVYLRPVAGRSREYPVRMSGEIPSRTAAVGAAPDVAAGRWVDDSLDRRWRDPTAAELRHDIDHFHLPPLAVAGDPSWAEWHYFNVLSADGTQWAFISYIVGGDIPLGRWGGQLLVTLHEHGGPPDGRRFVVTAPASSVRFSTARADVSIGGSSVTVLPDGRYRVRAHAVAAGGNGGFAPLDLDLVVTPAPGAYFSGAALSGGEIVSGYVVPALRADASGSICVRSVCERYSGAQAYHDHNWGVWRGVTWEWGAARAGPFSLLYGRVQQPDNNAAAQSLFVYVVDSLGFLALFRPRDIRYEDGRVIRVAGKAVRVPSRAVMFDSRGDDTLRIDLVVEDAAGTDTHGRLVERGEGRAARLLRRPYFIQMKGTASLSGRIGGRVIAARGPGFFETYR